jgi:hypothetical protein
MTQYVAESFLGENPEFIRFAGPRFAVPFHQVVESHKLEAQMPTA